LELVGQSKTLCPFTLQSLRLRASQNFDGFVPPVVENGIRRAKVGMPEKKGIVGPRAKGRLIDVPMSIKVRSGLS